MLVWSWKLLHDSSQAETDRFSPFVTMSQPRCCLRPAESTAPPVSWEHCPRARCQHCSAALCLRDKSCWWVQEAGSSCLQAVRAGSSALGVGVMKAIGLRLSVRAGLQHRAASLLRNRREIKFSTWLVWVTRICSTDLFLHYFFG